MKKAGNQPLFVESGLKPGQVEDVDPVKLVILPALLDKPRNCVGDRGIGGLPSRTANWAFVSLMLVDLR